MIRQQDDGRTLVLEASSGQLGGMDTCTHPTDIAHTW